MNSPITYHNDFEQGSEEWLRARCGLLTASEMKLIITPTLKIASNEKERAHFYELLAQRITNYVEPHYISDDMLRGREDEVRARLLYSEKIAPVTECGFITNARHGFTLGYSPDGLVGEHGLIECKSRRQKYQIETLLNHVPAQTCPPDYMVQCQTALLITERQWLDFISYSGGLPMCVIRVYPDAEVQSAILDAASAFEERIGKRMAEYQIILNSDARLFPTERNIEQEMII
jgi:predicted phage-related endonuclease